MAWGGGSFAQSLSRAGLIGEYVSVIHPVVFGSGLPMFAIYPRRFESTTAFLAGGFSTRRRSQPGHRHSPPIQSRTTARPACFEAALLSEYVVPSQLTAERAISGQLDGSPVRACPSTRLNW
jgi:hypothetical protein